jgi:sulfoxide reductase heme-binding subunit YedZ
VAPIPSAPDRRLKPAFYLASAVLAGWMLWVAAHPWRAFQPDRIDKDLGLWSLRFLFACLLASPVSRLLRAPWMRRWRRPLGLAAAAFALLHTLHFLVWGRIWPHRMEALLRRPYLTVGLVALVLFAPLAATSNDAAIRGLSPRRWRRLHLLVYPAAILSVAHEVMAYGPLMGEAGLYCLLLAVLVGAKLALAAWRPSPSAVA